MSIDWFSSGTEGKKVKMYDEIMASENFANMQHTWYKFLSFLSDDHDEAIRSYRIRIRELEAEVAELREDRARLDWLQDNHNRAPHDNKRDKWWWILPNLDFMGSPLLRAVIDTHRRAGR